MPIPGSRKVECIARNAAADDVMLAVDGMGFWVFDGKAVAKK